MNTAPDPSADLEGVARPVSTEDALQKIDKAWRVVTSLCDGTQGWTMNVPARPDSDPDLVIGQALRCASDLASERDALRAENEFLMRGLRGKHALTGATYEHLVSERDALAGRVRELEAERDAALADSERRHTLLKMQHAESVELYNALSDLSFECDGVTCVLPPSRETYNRTFMVLKMKPHLSPAALRGHSEAGGAAIATKEHS